MSRDRRLIPGSFWARWAISPVSRAERIYGTRHCEPLVPNEAGLRLRWPETACGEIGDGQCLEVGRDRNVHVIAERTQLMHQGVLQRDAGGPVRSVSYPRASLFASPVSRGPVGGHHCRGSGCHSRIFFGLARDCRRSSFCGSLGRETMLIYYRARLTHDPSLFNVPAYHRVRRNAYLKHLHG
jgi:hypothetical protein